MKLLALVLLLSAFSSLTLTEVVGSFKQPCSSFLIQKKDKTKKTNRQIDIIIPTIFPGHQYKKVCQRWKNKYRFATLYDTERKIPVFSAYTYLKTEVTECDKKKIKTQATKTKCNNNWKIEPQLEDFNEYKDKREMIDSPRNETTVNRIKNQALDLDYTNSGYTRGHVYPIGFAADQDQKYSTCTLTNIAPQTKHSNDQWAEQAETPMCKEMRDICKIQDQNLLPYVVTGVVPGNTSINITRNNIQKSINIPSHFWSTFCCTDKKNNLVFRAYLAELDNFTLRR